MEDFLEGILPSLLVGDVVAESGLLVKLSERVRCLFETNLQTIEVHISPIDTGSGRTRLRISILWHLLLGVMWITILMKTHIVLTAIILVLVVFHTLRLHLCIVDVIGRKIRKASSVDPCWKLLLLHMIIS